MFRTKYNLKDENGDLITKREYLTDFKKHESLTVPDQNRTIQELFDKYRSGIAPPVSQEQIYESYGTEDFDVNPLRSSEFDLTDLDDMRRDIKAAEAAVKQLEAYRTKKRQASEARQMSGEDVNNKPEGDVQQSGE